MSSGSGLTPVALARAASTSTAVSADPPPLSSLSLSRASSTGTASHQTSQNNNRVYKSNFKRSLKYVDVPPVLQQGIPVIRVYANGQKPKQQFLTLSKDKFTLYITSTPMLYNNNNNSKNNNNLDDSDNKRKGSWFSKGGKSSKLLPSVLRRNSSVGSTGTSSSDSVPGDVDNNNNKNNSTGTTEGSKRRANKEVRAIDIGSIHRIQRGAHNANLKTTTTSATTVQNLKTRRSANNRSSSNNSSNSNTNTNANNSIAFQRQDSIRSTTTSSSNNNNNNNNNSNNIPLDITDMINKPFDFKNPNFKAADNNGFGRSSLNSLMSGSNGNGNGNGNGNSGDNAGTILDPGSCFSIIFRGDWTLDLMMTDFDIMTTKSSQRDSANTNNGGGGDGDGDGDTSTTTSSNKTKRISNSNSSRITRDEILDALDKVIRTYSNAKQQVSNEVLLLRYVWTDSDQDKTNTIKINELGGVLERINYGLLAKNGKKSELFALYDNFWKVIGLKTKDKKLGLSFEQTCTLLHKLKRDSWIVKPINQYWNTLFGEYMNNGKPRMTVSDKTFLEKFLHKKQGERNATLKDVHELFQRLNDLELPHIASAGVVGLAKDPTRICKNRFEVYLLGEDNDAYDPIRESFNDRCMHHPISEYWINSSHNTYLTGDQFASSSSIDMYSNALYRGCKCLELDVWDGGFSGDGEPVPVVWHGHTMTSKILYKDIIKAIKLYVNFHPDTFPLILSYENHCSIPYQEVMAAQLIQILGDSLYIPKEDSLLGRLPSPSDLRGMVVIKGRRPANLEMDDIDDGNNSDDGAPSTIYMSDLSSQANSSLNASQHRQKMAQQKVCPALARLTLFHGTKLKGWDDSVMNPTHYMHSFSETKIKSLCRRTDRQKWVIYNQSHMSRSYPSGSRVDSSNYSPILPWALGTQLVALNFQTVDAPLLLNDGRFRENGGCGYVLKSTRLIDIQEPINEFNEENRVPVKLSVRVLSGSCLPKPNDARTGDCINPYVKVSVYDIRNGDKEISTTFSTGVVIANGFFPIWNGEKFTFLIENYETAMLQMTVYDKGSTIANATYTSGGDEFVASASIPISCLRKGLRSVKLFDTSNTRSGAFNFSSLLIDIKKEKAERIESTMAEI